MKKTTTLMVLFVLTTILLILCIFQSNVWFPLYSDAESDEITLILGHNQPEEHPVGVTLDNLGEAITEADNGIAINVIPNGQLGSEQDVIEQVQTGAVAMAKVSAAALENFEPAYKVYSLPYVFTSQEHYYNTMDNSEMVKEIAASTEDKGFIGLTWYDAGQRSIYCKDPAALKNPSDLKGLKVRVQPSETSINVINAMGASATPMSFGEVYTGLSQGVIDCAENNETALTDSNHGDVAKGYTYTSHQYTPDILIISTSVLEDLTEEQKNSITELALESTQEHKVTWNESIKNAVTKSETEFDPPVEFFEIDKTPFIESTKSLRDDFASENEQNKKILEDFASYDKGSDDE